MSLLIIALSPIPGFGQNNGHLSNDFYSSGEQHRYLEDNSMFSGLKWTSIGPTFQGGRVESIDCPIDQPGVIYAGFGSGSLWKTSNQGVAWECIFKNESTHSIGDLAISVSNPDIIYLGTGENLRASRGFSYPGTGVFKSIDAGKSWYNMGLQDSHHIGRIVIDPSDPNLVFAAAIGHFWSKNEERGLFMTSDGGQSWENILYISDSTGVVDVAWDAKNRIIYAAAWDMISGANSGIYKSENMGGSWIRLDNGFPVNNKIGRIGLALSPSRPETIYSLVDNRSSVKSEDASQLIGAEVFRSDDYGKNWKKTHENTLQNYSGFGWAFGDIKVSPYDHNDIYLMGVYLMNSSDGGQNFIRMGGRVNHIIPNTGERLHLDQHDLYIDPLHPSFMILGNDGGVYLTYDKGESWTHCNTIPVGEFYDISIVDSDTVRIYGGTQDNSSIKGLLIPEDPEALSHSWEYVWLDPWSGGDGFTTLESPENRNLIFYESQNGYLSLKNLVSGKTKHIKPSPDSDESPLRNSWFTPYFISAHDVKTIYYGANKLYKSIDQGESWIRLSPDLSYSEDKGKKSRSITAIAESPLMAGLLFAGTEKGIVWVSRNDGTKWIEISKGVPQNKVLSIIPSTHNSSIVYLVCKGMDNDDYSPCILMSNNLGKSWTDISNGLPYESVNCLTEDPVIEGLIYIGTDRGIYCSPDNGYSWEALSYSLPTTSVHQLKFIKNNKFILAATHGMSLFIAHTEPIRTYYANSLRNKPFYMTGIDGRLPKQKDYSGDWDLNTIRNLQISFFWPDTETISISLFNDSDESIYREIFNAKTGINQWDWDLIIEKKEDNTIYPVPEISFPKTGYYSIVIEGPSGTTKGPARIADK